MRIRMTEKREDRLRRLMQETGENTKAGAIDVAIKHYLADLEAKRRVISELDDELLEDLSTPWIPLIREVEVEEQVGMMD